MSRELVTAHLLVANVCVFGSHLESLPPYRDTRRKQVLRLPLLSLFFSSSSFYSSSSSSSFCCYLALSHALALIS